MLAAQLTRRARREKVSHSQQRGPTFDGSYCREWDPGLVDNVINGPGPS